MDLSRRCGAGARLWHGSHLVEAEATPVHYNGSADADRPVRHLRIWLDAGARHLPLRMEVPVGPANLIMRLSMVRGRI